MSRADYNHWNEEGDQMWWLEEGRFGSEEPDYDPYLEMAEDDFDEDDE